MKRAEISAGDLRAFVLEGASLVGGRIEKVYSVGTKELVLRIRGEEGRRDLVLSSGSHAFIAQERIQAPKTPSPVALSFRSALSGGRIARLFQHGFDRVLRIEVERGPKESVEIVAELFGEGNVVLLRGGKVLAALDVGSRGGRSIRPGAPYVFPPERADPLNMGFEEFRRIFRSSTSDVVRTLATGLGLGGRWGEEVCVRCGVPKEKKVVLCTEKEESSIFEALREVVRRATLGPLEPGLVYREGKLEGAVPFEFRIHEGCEFRRTRSFSEALEEYFTHLPESIPRPDLSFEEQRRKLLRRIEAQKRSIEEFEKEAIEERKKGEFLLSHLDPLEEVRRRVFDALKRGGWEEAKKEFERTPFEEFEFVPSLVPSEGALLLKVSKLGEPRWEIRLSLSVRISKQASDFFERSKRAQSKKEGALQALEEARGALEKLHHSPSTPSPWKPPRSSRTFWFESFRWFFSSSGHLVLGGRDARSNEKLVRKHMGEGDLYVHADLPGAPSVVIRREGAGEIPPETIEEAAIFAVSTSKAWVHGIPFAEAFWVRPEQVSKTPNPGEFLARGAFVIRGRKNFLKVKLAHAVGEVVVEGETKIMGGPPSAVASRSTRWVLLEPGDESPNEVANALSRSWGHPVEAFQSALPPGGVRVVRSEVEVG